MKTLRIRTDLLTDDVVFVMTEPLPDTGGKWAAIFAFPGEWFHNGFILTPGVIVSTVESLERTIDRRIQTP